jgi:hypothetical protein
LRFFAENTTNMERLEKEKHPILGVVLLFASA